MKATWNPLPPGRFGSSTHLPGSDPLFALADSSDFRDFLRPGAGPLAELPVLCELVDDMAILALADELARTGGGGLPAAYPRVPGRTTRYCTALFSADYAVALAAGQVGSMISRFEMQMPVLPGRPAPLAPAPQLPLARSAQRPKATGALLLGAIDSGCPFAHASLRRPDGGSRLLAIWDQDVVPGYADIGGACPDDLGYGAEVHRRALDALIADCRSGGALDEDACYRRAGLRGLRRRLSHGAAVLDLMAGARTLGARLWRQQDEPPSWCQADDAASRADIVFVDLPRDSVQDASSGGLGRWLLDGLRYICSCAGPDTRDIVVTISNGTSRSTHDGNSIIERAMAALVQEQAALKRRLRIVVAAGNDRDEERHAQIDRLVPGKPVPITLRVPPGSESPAWVTVRVPPQAGSLTLRLWPPGGDESRCSPSVTAGNSSALTLPGHAPLAAIVFPQPRPGEAGMALVMIAATVRHTGGVPAPHGDWQVFVGSDQELAAPVHLFVSRNQCNPGALPRSHQARWVADFIGYDPLHWRRRAEVDPVPAQSPIRRAGTLNGLATLAPDQGVVVVGSVHLRPGTPSPYSSAGPSAAPAGAGARAGPDLAAVTDLYRGLRGIVVAGARSGAVVRVLGTSFAAPQAARYIANHGELPPSGTAPDPALTGRGGGFS